MVTGPVRVETTVTVRLTVIPSTFKVVPDWRVIGWREILRLMKDEKYLFVKQKTST
jgi:hypothetical protein